MTLREDLPYRPCVGIALFNSKGLTFIGRRKRKRGAPLLEQGLEWQMPQGGIDPGETPRAAALRELYEETSVSSVTLLGELPDWLHYEIPAAIAATRWKGGFRGQKQKWFAFRFDGDDAEINVTRPADGAHPSEFDTWRWEDLGHLADLVVSFKRELYIKVTHAFAPFSAGHSQT